MDLHVGRRFSGAEISSLLSEARERTLLLTNSLSGNAEYLRFMEDDGYARPEFGCDAGWAWKCEASLVALAYWTQADGEWYERCMDRTASIEPSSPVCHICYWEAEAYAAWSGKRLPSESEWEAAASWGPGTGSKSLYPWGNDAPRADRANLDRLPSLCRVRDVSVPRVLGGLLRGRIQSAARRCVGDAVRGYSKYLSELGLPHSPADLQRGALCAR
jgi:hypothetical protein